MVRRTNILVVGLFLFCCGFIQGEEHGFSSGVEEVVKLAKTGMEEAVLLEYVKKSDLSFDISTDEIVMLNDLGVSDKVIVAMLSRGKLVRGNDISSTQGAPGTPMDAEEEEEVGEKTPPATGKTRKKSITSVPPPVAPENDVADISYFYDVLTPYGSWVELDEYGWCWQPTTVSIDVHWRPYANRGRWVWTDAGWYWRSGYSWGWATFHYGRWTYLDSHRWVWVPGTVWAPAWVHWRHSDSHVGWAPLPPKAKFEVGLGFRYQGKKVGVDFNFGLRSRDFVFVAGGSFVKPNLISYCEPPSRVTNIYNRTTIINNSYTVNNTTIINKGVPIERIRKASNQEIRQVRLVNNRPQPGKSVVNHRISNGELPVYRPRIENKAPRNPQLIAQQRKEALEKRRMEMEALRRIRIQNRLERKEPSKSSGSPTTNREATPNLEKIKERQKQAQEERNRRQEEGKERRESRKSEAEKRQEQRRQKREEKRKDSK